MNLKNNHLFLAPLAGVSETIFRTIGRQLGADAVVSEMVSAEGLLRNGKQTLRLCTFAEEERPIGIQLFGSDPERLADAAAAVEANFHPDFIDLNSGCPVPKVVSRNGGAALLRNPELFGRIVAKMAGAVKTPVTVKLRSGWHTGEWVDEEFARIAEANGAAVVFLHARSKAMRYSGQAILERIAAVKKSVSIPVIGNGDICTAADAMRMLNETGCDGLMIGRGAVGNPWIFGQIKAALRGEKVELPSLEVRGRALLDHIAAYRTMYGERLAVKEMRKHTSWYMKGMSHATVFRDRIFRAQNTATLEEVARDAFLNT